MGCALRSQPLSSIVGIGAAAAGPRDKAAVLVSDCSVHPEGEVSAGCAQSGQPRGLQETGHCSVVIRRAGGSS